jgi:DNA helicase II / ATP-dependent DNA helicase PcrA
VKPLLASVVCSRSIPTVLRKNGGGKFLTGAIPDFFKGLNPAQFEAASHVDGPLLVLAGPGSGKTRVVTARIAHLLTLGVADDRIVALTFTNKAADEMRQRVGRQFPRHQVWISTFHRFCSMLLRRYGRLVGLEENFTILDSDDSLSTIKNVIEDHAIRTGRYSPGQIARAISNGKNVLSSPEDFRTNAHTLLQEVSGEVYQEYQRRLIRSNSVDFDDLLMHVANILRENQELQRLLDVHFQYVLVDEYQDTNMAQYTIVRGLSLEAPNVSVTGDPDQSIYSWRGADIANILRFERDFPNAKVVRLEKNYRSTKSILAAADRLIRHNQQRKQKDLVTDNPVGDPVRISEYGSGEEEAFDIAGQIASLLANPKTGASPQDFAIFYRTNALSRALERALGQQRIPYRIIHGLEFYRRKEVRDIVAYLQLINNPRNDVAFLRLVNEPSRGIGRSSLDKLREFAMEEEISLFEAAGNPVVHKRLTRRPAKAMEHLVAWLRELIAKPELAISDVVQTVLNKSGYEDHLRFEAGEEELQRLANIKELVTAAREFEQSTPKATLEQFLEVSTLAGETDKLDRQAPAVTMMTLHAAKGLEFPHAFVVAVEHGLIPHELAMREGDAQEEERRLLFVGITRAMNSLQLSFARYRDFAGDSRRRIPSPFLGEVQGPLVSFQQVTNVPLPETNEPDESSQLDLDEEHSTKTRRFDPNSLPSIGVASRSASELPAKKTPKRGTLRLAAAVDIQNDVNPPLPSEGSPKASTPSKDMTMSLEEFRAGRLVSHPIYGIGKIMAVTGTGVQTTCRIQFFDPLEQRSFRVAVSPLEVIGG